MSNEARFYAKQEGRLWLIIDRTTGQPVVRQHGGSEPTKWVLDLNTFGYIDTPTDAYSG